VLVRGSAHGNKKRKKKMKKIVMMCAIAAAVASAHAASMKWGGAIAAEDGETALSGGETAYLLFSDTAFGTINSFNTSTLTTDAGGTMVQSHTISSAEAGGYVFSETYSADYTQMNGYYAAILVNGSDMYYNTFQVTEFTSATTPMQDKTLNADWSGGDYLGNPARKGTVTGGGIPEPTSGLLLLIGGAMLALRRKQK